MKSKTITVKFKRSTISCTETQRATIRGLGFRRLHEVKTLPNTPEVRGMIKKVIHLVSVVSEN